MKRIILTELREECGGCPTKYSGRTIDGEYFGAYFRYGNMTISLDETTIISATNVNFNGADGVCSFNDFKDLALVKGVVIDESNVSWSSEIEDTEKLLQSLIKRDNAKVLKEA